jgi:hypothetical protein
MLPAHKEGAMRVSAVKRVSQRAVFEDANRQAQELEDADFRATWRPHYLRARLDTDETARALRTLARDGLAARGRRFAAQALVKMESAQLGNALDEGTGWVRGTIALGKRIEPTADPETRTRLALLIDQVSAINRLSATDAINAAVENIRASGVDFEAYGLEGWAEKGIAAVARLAREREEGFGAELAVEKAGAQARAALRAIYAQFLELVRTRIFLVEAYLLDPPDIHLDLTRAADAQDAEDEDDGAGEGGGGESGPASEGGAGGSGL